MWRGVSWIGREVLEEATGVSWIGREVLGEAAGVSWIGREATDFVFMMWVALLKMKRFLRNVGCTYHSVRRHDIEKNVRTPAYRKFCRKLTRFAEYFGIPVALLSLL